ncbi:MAG: sulfatase [Bryobacter sp.]|jgi:arylsulfatase A-like enzyme|nr:sulfatase [Bryobacter sp. CoA8 C33]
MPVPPRRRDLLASLASPALLSGAQQRPPNLVLVLSDDHSRPHAGCFGNPVIQTPVIDRMAADGIKLDHMFTAAPQCVPSRSALLTGRSPVANRMGRFASPMPPEIPTLPELLRQKNYYTGIARRYFHLDGVNNPTALTRRIYEDNDMRTWSKRVDSLHIGGNRDQTAHLFNQFIDSAGTRPFFYWVNFSDPHHVWDRNAIPKPHDPARIPLPPHLPDLPGVRDDLARYYDEITRADEELGFVLSTLEKRGIAENTLVLFMGDNGHAFPHGKGSLYDPGLNVPCLACWPGRIRPGSASPQLLSGEDVTPTFLDAAGLPVPSSMSGRSFLPLLEGRPNYQPRSHIFAARLPHGNSNYTAETKASTFDLSRCARSRTHKLIWNYTPYQEYWPVDSARDAGWQQILAAHAAGKLAPELDRAYFSRPRPVVELFDLAKDPSELDNLAGRPEYAAIELDLKTALQEKMVKDYDFLPPPFDEAAAPNPVPALR